MEIEQAPAPPEGAPGKQRRGRVGRDLPVATTVGFLLAAALVIPLYAARPVFLAVVVAAIAVATWELTRALRVQGSYPPLPPLLIGGATLLVLAYREGAGALVAGVVLTAIGCLAWRASGPAAGYLRDASAAALVAVYVPFLAGFAALLAAPPDGPRRVTILLATVVLSDVGGFAAGVLMGRHPMAPTVSPRKTWEGFAGSAGACVTGAAVLLPLLLDAAVWQGVLFGLAVVIAATLGDLAESMIKRDIGIKDMGTLLPGHGGIMDRLDSLLPSAPVAWVLLSAFVPPG